MKLHAADGENGKLSAPVRFELMIEGHSGLKSGLCKAGLLALSLAALGLYGVMAYTVTQRTRELGIRICVGAKQGDVLKLILGHGLTLAVIGMIGGLITALAVTRLSAHLLYGVSASDPVTFTGIAILLLGVALVASYFPARRATKFDPMIALRMD